MISLFDVLRFGIPTAVVLFILGMVFGVLSVEKNR